MKILYCDDSASQRATIVDMFGICVSGCEIIIARGAVDGLEAVTGVGLRALRPLVVESVIRRLSGYDISGLSAVVTDGEMTIEQPGLFYGWELAEVLRGIGYRGKVVYFGNTPVPDEKKGFFDELFEKGDYKGLLRVVLG